MQVYFFFSGILQRLYSLCRKYTLYHFSIITSKQLQNQNRYMPQIPILSTL